MTTTEKVAAGSAAAIVVASSIGLMLGSNEQEVLTPQEPAPIIQEIKEEPFEYTSAKKQELIDKTQAKTPLSYEEYIEFTKIVDAEIKKIGGLEYKKTKPKDLLKKVLLDIENSNNNS